MPLTGVSACTSVCTVAAWRGAGSLNVLCPRKDHYLAVKRRSMNPPQPYVSGRGHACSVRPRASPEGPIPAQRAGRRGQGWGREVGMGDFFSGYDKDLN